MNTPGRKWRRVVPIEPFRISGLQSRRNAGPNSVSNRLMIKWDRCNDPAHYSHRPPAICSLFACRLMMHSCYGTICWPMMTSVTSTSAADQQIVSVLHTVVRPPLSRSIAEPRRSHSPTGACIHRRPIGASRRDALLTYAARRRDAPAAYGRAAPSLRLQDVYRAVCSAGFQGVVVAGGGRAVGMLQDITERKGSSSASSASPPATPHRPAQPAPGRALPRGRARAVPSPSPGVNHACTTRICFGPAACLRRFGGDGLALSGSLFLRTRWSRAFPLLMLALMGLGLTYMI